MNSNQNNIATFCFLLGLFFYILLHDYLLPQLITNDVTLKVTIELLSTFGFYVLVYQGFLFLYDRYLDKRINPRLDIDGDWYQVFTTGDGANVEIRHGPCRITRGGGNIVISATNLQLDNTMSSNWQSDSVSIIGNKIMLLFTSEGRSRQTPIKRGSIVFNLHGIPPDELIGIFNDLSPGNNYGDIRLFRQETAYKSYLGDISSNKLIQRDF